MSSVVPFSSCFNLSQHQSLFFRSYQILAIHANGVHNIQISFLQKHHSVSNKLFCMHLSCPFAVWVFFFLSHLSFSLRFLYANYQFSSVAQSCLTLCNPMNRSTPGLPVHHQLPEFTQTHVHRAKKTSASRHLSWEHIDFETVSKNVGLKKTAQKDIAASGHSLILKRYQDP